MTFTLNPSCIGTFNAAAALGISTFTLSAFPPTTLASYVSTTGDYYAHGSSNGLINGFAAPQNSLFPNTRPFSISSDIKLANEVVLHVLSPLKPPTFTPLHAHAFAAGANGYIAAPDKPTEKLEAASSDEKYDYLLTKGIIVKYPKVGYATCFSFFPHVFIMYHLDKLGVCPDSFYRIFKQRLKELTKNPNEWDDAQVYRHSSHNFLLTGNPNKWNDAAEWALGQIVADLDKATCLNFALMLEEIRAHHQNDEVRAFAIRALGQIVPHLDKSLQLDHTLKVESGLGHRDGRTIEEMYYNYDGLAHDAAKEALKKIVPDLDPGDRLKVAQKIAERLGDEDGYVRYAAINALRHIVPHLDPADCLKLAQKVEERLGAKVGERRKEALWVLNDIVPRLDPSDRLGTALKIAGRLEDGDADVRKAAIEAFANIAPHLDPADRPWLPLGSALIIAMRLGDGNADVRKAALWASGKLVSDLDRADLLKVASQVAGRLKQWGPFANAAIKAFSNIVPRLDPSDRLEPTLRIAERLDGWSNARYAATEALGKIVPYLDRAELLCLAHKVADRLEAQSGEVRQAAILVLHSIVPRLDPANQLKFALEIAERVNDEGPPRHL
ncbi:MAG: hypothetical protein ABH871_06700 [Pseudomonadota bacterium]